MSFSSVKGLLSSYSRLSGDDSSSDNEKDYQLPLHHGSHSPSPSSSSTLHENHQLEKQQPEQQSRSIIDSRFISDAIIGLSDGMTVPFALTAGLSALEDTKVVVFGGLAELIAGAISMGLGGYLGAKSEEASYKATLQETQKATLSSSPSTTTSTISSIFAPYDLPAPLLSDLTTHLSSSPHLPTFLMNFQHQLPEPSDSRALVCALTIAMGYFLGGFVPLVPYFFVGGDEAFVALRWSIATMAVALFVFGYGKTCFVSGWKGARNVRGGLWGGVTMVLVGGVAAGSAMGLVKVFSILANRY